MAKVVIRRPSGETFEISDITFEQVKELAGVNGYRRPSAPSVVPPSSEIIRSIDLKDDDSSKSDFDNFFGDLNDRGRLFILHLRDHPEGIEANALAGLLNLQDARQIGGLTGGGIAKIAKKHKVKIGLIYFSKVAFPGGKRIRMFYPGKLVKAWEHEEKPA